MQMLTVVGRIVFVGFIYLFLLRILTVMLADLRSRGIMSKTESDLGCIEVLGGAEKLPKGRKIKIDSRGLSIGRGKHNDIVVPDHYCSLDHAEFKHNRGMTTLEDVGSTNGTWVNGERINSQVQLVSGDFIKIGSITFLYSRWGNESS
ncbi:FHA domain protein containing protein [Dehalobacter sp. UNSWDHB]|uniref:FHA domain-containing protein n=1 Tax=unclassified Dehalobacter TaxID=2635733 RepID=UPI00028AAD25|nr:MULTISPECIES: FHA domain-containing protein [unclassified Dehalobacter]AFV03201.1 FHA domain containing protein [Dehalobacter sp. DCA]AFV06187.1 FHA domain containing protein [Dehalobacter sp. CF]EQB20600.1 FHA domain protein containing protein [Dehalobacter sp. UNSWDHB]OCZ54883.1 FHA domain-containing protein [Dehalobacter sp. TeCB1]